MKLDPSQTDFLLLIGDGTKFDNPLMCRVFRGPPADLMTGKKYAEARIFAAVFFESSMFFQTFQRLGRKLSTSKKCRQDADRADSASQPTSGRGMSFRFAHLFSFCDSIRYLEPTV